MTTETIYVDGKPETITLKPITILCHPGNVKLDSPGRYEINPQRTIECADGLPALAWENARKDKAFIKMFKMVFTDMEPPEHIQSEGMGVKHVIGLIVLIKLAEWHKVPAFIRLPESFLHPRNQAGLADLLVFLTK